MSKAEELAQEACGYLRNPWKAKTELDDGLVGRLTPSSGHDFSIRVSSNRLQMVENFLDAQMVVNFDVGFVPHAQISVSVDQVYRHFIVPSNQPDLFDRRGVLIKSPVILRDNRTGPVSLDAVAPKKRGRSTVMCRQALETIIRSYLTPKS